MGMDDFDKFEFREKLGSGGMGDVYRGLDRSLDREVAIKILKSELSASEELLGRFREEARTAARLQHPNVASVFSFEKVGGLHMLVMEYVHGRNLDTKLREEGALRPAPAVDLFLQVLRGIGHAHSMQIVHRDIKPANILVTSLGTVKVTDFGIARMLGTARQTVQGGMIGTIEYMSPERILNQPTDSRSDIYSLGVVLYEMLAGRHPFEGMSEYELLRRQVEGSLPPLKSLGVDVPAGLEAAIQRAVEKLPERRFQNVEEFARAVAPFGSLVPAQSGEEKATRLAPPAAFAAFEEGGRERGRGFDAAGQLVRKSAWWLPGGKWEYLAIAALVVVGIGALVVIFQPWGGPAPISDQGGQARQADLPPRRESTRPHLEVTPPPDNHSVVAKQDSPVVIPPKKDPEPDGPVPQTLVGSWKASGSFQSIGMGCCNEWLTIKADGTATVQGSYHFSGTCASALNNTQALTCSAAGGQLVTTSATFANILGNYSYNMLGGELPNMSGGNFSAQITQNWRRQGSGSGLAGTWETVYPAAGMTWHLTMTLDETSNFKISGDVSIPFTMTAKNRVFRLVKNADQKTTDGTYEILSSDLFRTTGSKGFAEWMRVSAPGN